MMFHYDVLGLVVVLGCPVRSTTSLSLLLGGLCAVFQNVIKEEEE
jgi:hypothetical protein